MPRKVNTPRIYTDEEITAMPNVPPEIAGAYLGKSPQHIRVCLQYKRFPIGYAYFTKRWTYCIPGPALVRYKQTGAVN